MARGAGGDRLPAALRLNFLPRTRRAVACERTGISRTRSWPGRGRAWRSRLRPRLPRRKRNQLSAAGGRKTRSLPGAGAGEREPVPPVAQGQCPGARTRQGRRAYAAPIGKKSVSTWREFRFRARRRGPLCAFQQNLRRQRLDRSAAPRLALSGAVLGFLGKCALLERIGRRDKFDRRFAYHGLKPAN